MNLCHRSLQFFFTTPGVVRGIDQALADPLNRYLRHWLLCQRGLGQSVQVLIYDHLSRTL